MAKDAKGHGSEARSGGGSYPNIDNNLNGPGKHVGYGNGVWRIQKYGAGATTYMGTHRETGANIYGRTLGEISQKLGSGAGSSPAVAVAEQHGIPTDHLGGHFGGADPAPGFSAALALRGVKLDDGASSAGRPQSSINRIKQPADVIGRPWKGPPR